MIDLRLRTRIAEDAIRDTLAGRVLGPRDYDLLLTGAGPVRVRMPDNRPLCVYLPGALTEAITPEVYAVLHSLRPHVSVNRGAASGTRRIYKGPPEARAKRGDSVPISSALLGAIDAMGGNQYCRLTAWTGRNLPEWELLHPLLRAVAGNLAAHLPDRYAAQAARAAASHPAWIVPGTPFSTITVNNTYPTGTHTDKGDLDEGFSTLACVRRGEYTGGQLIFPAFRVAVDLRDGDLLLMDAHQWHGNAPITCQCGTRLNGPCPTCQAERISVVSYYRTKIDRCGDPAAEGERFAAVRERRSGLAPAT